MKRSLAVVAVLGMSAALSGCFFSSEDKPAATPAQAAVAPLWKLNLETKCAGDASQCVAAYGFTLTPDGKYLVGPATDGQTASGQLTAEEFQTLEEKLSALNGANADESGATDANSSTGTSAASTSATSNPVCEALNSADQDILTLTMQGEEHILSETHDSKRCYMAANAQGAADLLDYVKQLATEYYPLPFPNLCNDQMSALESLYATAQSCNTDADCAYVSDFKIVPSSTDQWITTDSCTPVKPLAVASVAGLAAQSAALTQAYNSALAACGVSAQSAASCDGFMSSVGAPACQQGVCRVRTAAPEQQPAPSQPVSSGASSH